MVGIEHFCAADQRRPANVVLSVDTDFTSGGIFQRERGRERERSGNARIRLIQYISGRKGGGVRGSQSSILLTESSTLSGPPVIILGDHIARILTNSDTNTHIHKDRGREMDRERKRIE